MDALPLLDLTPLRTGEGDEAALGTAVDAACRQAGFFYVTGHGVLGSVVERLDSAARAFFALPEDEKATIAMERGGRAWRGWFPLGDELTAGVPDRKEGVYFGTDLVAGDERVQRGLPLHGANLWPVEPAELRSAVLDYMHAVTEVGALALRAIALGLGLHPRWFEEHLTADPLVLFRLFRYPELPHGEDGWGVAEHTDYGLITVLYQDEAGGLEVRGPRGWIPAPPIPGTFVVNLGDMLERMTAGQYRSTPHRVRNTTNSDRLSFPLFLDPGWDVEVPMIPGVGAQNSSARSDEAGAPPHADGEPPGTDRWDGQDPMAWEGTYGDYVLTKVAQVFPELAKVVALPHAGSTIRESG